MFKVLGNESRLWLLRLIGEQQRTVGELAQLTGLSQPLVSQHLRSLRQGGLVTAERSGKEMFYDIADTHVTHVVADAVSHVLEDPGTS
nr:metalloregulator ArsR/SmtB family transcription factor [Kineosporia babensis]